MTNVSKHNMKRLLLGGLFAAVASSANAGLLDGKTVNYQYFYADLSSPYSGAANGDYVVGAGVEVSNAVDGQGTVDLQSDGFTIHFTGASSFNSGSFNGFRISDVLGAIGSFTSLTMISNTSLSGAPVLTFDSDNLYVNMVDLEFGVGDVVFGVNAIPEPETYAMLLAGLGLLGFAARRRQRKLAAA